MGACKPLYQAVTPDSSVLCLFARVAKQAAETYISGVSSLYVFSTCCGSPKVSQPIIRYGPGNNKSSETCPTMKVPKYLNYIAGYQTQSIPVFQCANRSQRCLLSTAHAQPGLIFKIISSFLRLVLSCLRTTPKRIKKSQFRCSLRRTTCR